MIVRLRFKIATILITSGIVAVVLGQDRRAEVAPGNASIHEEQLRADLLFIASDLLQGRMTGTTGNQIAAEFIRLGSNGWA